MRTFSASQRLRDLLFKGSHHGDHHNNGDQYDKVNLSGVTYRLLLEGIIIFKKYSLVPVTPELAKLIVGLKPLDPQFMVWNWTENEQFLTMVDSTLSGGRLTWFQQLHRVAEQLNC